MTKTCRKKTPDARIKAADSLLANSNNYRALVEDANSIILRMDTEGNITFFNEFALDFFSYQENEILGKNVIGTIVPSTAASGEDLKAMIRDIMANPGKYINNENENIRKTGERVWVSWTNRPVLDDKKRLKEILCVGNDITKLKQTTQERFERLIESLSEGVITCNLNWKINYANAAAKKYFDIKDIEGTDLAQLIFEGYSVSLDRRELTDLSSAPKQFDITREESDRFKALYIEANLNALKNPRGDIEGIIMLFRNVTEERREEMLKQNFLSLISHKLSTPTNTISQSALLLQEGIIGSLNEQQKDCVEGIINKTAQLKNLVANLLTFTMINSKELDFKQESIEADVYLQGLIESFKKNKTGKNVEYSLEGSGKGIIFNIARKHLDLIMFNLLDNAVKFSDKEKIAIKIGVGWNGQKAEIIVSDNGCGIPPEEQDKVFEKFYQIERSFTGNIPGAGLGLALVKRLVAGYGGSIDLESKLEEGSRFTVTLPAVMKNIEISH